MNIDIREVATDSVKSYNNVSVVFIYGEALAYVGEIETGRIAFVTMQKVTVKRDNEYESSMTISAEVY